MYLKLKDLSSFTVKEFVKKYFGRWNEAEKKYERADTWQQGFRPTWTFKVNNDEFLDFSQDQLSQMLVACFDRRCDIYGSTFTVKTNGKSGMDIRYFINLLEAQNRPTMAQQPSEQANYQLSTENSYNGQIDGNNATGDMEIRPEDIPF
jgi:hypothetical protein